MKSIICVVLLYISVIYGQFNGMEGIQVPISSQTKIWALIHLPQDYATTNTKYPLIFFHHGMGETSKNGEKSELINTINGKTGPCAEIYQRNSSMEFTVNSVTYKFIVVCPQVPNSNPWIGAGSVDMIYNYIVSNYRVDRQRFYITGLSLGGYISTNYIANQNSLERMSKVAAYGAMSPAPIDTNNNKNLCNAAYTGTAGWYACGTSDSFWASTLLKYQILNGNNSGSEPGCNPKAIAKLNTYQGVGHSSSVWSQMYSTGHQFNNPNLYEWFLQYKLTNSSLNNAITTKSPSSVTTKSNSITTKSNSVTTKANVVTTKSSPVTTKSVSNSVTTKASSPPSTVTTAAIVNSGNETVTNNLIDGEVSAANYVISSTMILTLINIAYFMLF